MPGIVIIMVDGHLGLKVGKKLEMKKHNYLDNSREGHMLLFTGLVAVIAILVVFVFFPVDEKLDGFGTLSKRQESSNTFAREGDKSSIKVNQEVKGRDEVKSDSDNYKITYLVTNNQYIVTIKKAPVDAAKQAAIQEIKKNLGVSDICTIRVNFVPTKEIRPLFKLGDAKPSECK